VQVFYLHSCFYKGGTNGRGSGGKRCNELEEIGKIAIKTFLVLEKVWQSVGRRLVDLKVEFGINADGQLRLADVIDNDSWRVLDDWQYIDKQLYRDGVDLKTVLEKYKMVADLTDNFTNK